MDDPERLHEFTSSPLFRKLIADAKNIESDLASFQERYGELVRADTSGMSVILRAHLIVEHFVDEYLTRAHPGVHDWEAARLSFAQKLSLIDHPRTNLSVLMPGLRALNRARNKVAHTLDETIPSADLEPIEQFIGIWYGAAGKPIPSGMEVVTHFALTAAAFLYSNSQMIDRHCPEGGIVGLLAWYQQ